MRGRSKDSGQTEEAGDGPAHERRGERRGGTQAGRQAASEGNEEAQQRQGPGGRLLPNNGRKRTTARRGRERRFYLYKYI